MLYQQVVYGLTQKGTMKLRKTNELSLRHQLSTKPLLKQTVMLPLVEWRNAETTGGYKKCAELVGFGIQLFMTHDNLQELSKVGLCRARLSV